MVINILEDKTLKLKIQASQECRTQQLHSFNYAERQDCRIKKEEKKTEKKSFKWHMGTIRLQKNKTIA